LINFQKIQLSAFGAPTVLKVVEATKNPVGPDDVRIKVVAAGVGFADIMAQRGGYPLAPSLPFTPGYDVVGTVEEIGSRVTSLRPGQMVVALNPAFGCYAQYTTFPAALAVPVPVDVDPFEAVCLVLNYLTAHAMLYRMAQISAGQSVLIHSAAGGVGSALVQLGQLTGLKMYGTSSKVKHAMLAESGVTPIDYQTEDFLQRVLHVTGTGVDAAFDATGGAHLLKSYRAVKRGGCVVSYGFSAGKFGGILPMAVGVLQLGLFHLLPDGKRIHLCATPGMVKKDNAWYRATLQELLNLLRDGKLKPVIGARVPLLEAPRAHALVESGQAVGKVLLVA
jgi:NADPH:quinone reductase-like Zn-dependent oxidoreductase